MKTVGPSGRGGKGAGSWDPRSQKGFVFDRKFLAFSSASRVSAYKHAIQFRNKPVFDLIWGVGTFQSNIKAINSLSWK